MPAALRKGRGMRKKLVLGRASGMSGTRRLGGGSTLKEGIVHSSSVFSSQMGISRGSATGTGLGVQ